MNMFKKNGGFTLVELIIVIAILAILSSVAVAGYSAYITKANDSAVKTFLNDMKTHVALANAKGGAVTSITVDGTGHVTVVVEAKASDFETNLAAAYTGATNVEYTEATKTIEFDINLPSNWGNSTFGKKTTPGASWSENDWQ